MGRNLESRSGIPFESPGEALTHAVELTADNRRIRKQVEEAGGLREGETWPSNYIVNKIAIVYLVGEQGAQELEAMLDDLENRAKKG